MMWSDVIVLAEPYIDCKSTFVSWHLFFCAEQLFYFLVDLRQCLHGFGIALTQLAIQGIFANQRTQLLWYVAFIPVRAICSAKHIGREFGHVLVHSVTLKPIITGCKCPVRRFLTVLDRNTTDWSQKRSQKMVQATDIA